MNAAAAKAQEIFCPLGKNWMEKCIDAQTF